MNHEYQLSRQVTILIGAALFTAGLVFTCSPFLQLAIAFEVSNVIPEGLLQAITDYFPQFFWGSVVGMWAGLSILVGALLPPKPQNGLL